MKLCVDCDPSESNHIIFFEPRHSTSEGLGLNTQESLPSVHSDIMVLIPVEYFQGIPIMLMHNLYLQRAMSLKYLC